MSNAIQFYGGPRDGETLQIPGDDIPLHIEVKLPGMDPDRVTYSYGGHNVYGIAIYEYGGEA